MQRYLCPQYQTHGCGVACVKTALGLLRKDGGYRLAPEPPCEETAPNLEELIAYAERFGLGLGAYRIAPEELLLAEEFPLFLVYAREGKTHMRLLLRVRRGRYCAYDPIEGVKRGKKEELLEGFSGVFLRVERDSGGRSEAQRSVLPLSLRLFPTLFSVLAMAFFLAGSLTLGSTLPFWVPLASLAIGVSFMLLFASSSYWGMKRFDEAFQGRIRDEDPSRRQEKFRLFHAYKQKVFGRGMGGLFSLLLSLSIASALAFRDLALGITFLIAFAFLTLSWSSDVPKAERKKKEISRLETEILSDHHPPVFKEETIETCLKEAREYSRYYLLRGILVFLLSCLLSLASLALQNRLTFDAFVYYLFPVFFFVEQVDGTYGSFRNRREEKRLENRFVGAFVLADAKTRTQEGENGLQ